MSQIDFARRQVRELRSTVDELLIGGPGKEPIRDPLPKALQHLDDLNKERQRLPNRAIDPEEHDRCIRALDGHCVAAQRYLEAYRSIIGPAIPNPEGETDPSPVASRAARSRRRCRPALAVHRGADGGASNRGKRRTISSGRRSRAILIERHKMADALILQITAEHQRRRLADVC